MLPSSLCLLLAFTFAADPPKLSPEEAKEGFVPLFNGKDFQGWRFGDTLPEKLPANWKVADGVIKLSGGGAPHLASMEEYANFELRLEWRGLKANYNSGLYVRSGKSVAANQINLAQKSAGNLMGGAKGGKAVPELQKEPGEWNEWRVIADGTKLTFYCNGKLAWEVVDFKPDKGYIGLQAEGQPMEFRNIRIKKLP
jgi:hypothetical protein